MDQHRFAALSDLVTHAPSRRHVLHGLAGLGIAIGAHARPEDADAKKRKKKRKKKKDKKLPPLPPTTPPPPPPPPGVPNQYGCFSVDVNCTSADECCTGICEGGTCKAHGAGSCRQELPGVCLAGDPETAHCNNSEHCLCMETTGESKFCGYLPGSSCTDCRKDTDCLALGFPAGSSCTPVGTGSCVGHCASGMMCVYPCAT